MENCGEVSFQGEEEYVPPDWISLIISDNLSAILTQNKLCESELKRLRENKFILGVDFQKGPSCFFVACWTNVSTIGLAGMTCSMIH